MYAMSLCRSMSFIFVLGAGAFLLLTLCYILVDVMEVWSGAPFYFPGRFGSSLASGFDIIITCIF